MPKQPAKANKKKNLFKNEFAYLSIVLGTIFIFFLTTFNIDHYLEKQKVLCSATAISSSRNEIAFWEIFLYENENYIEGWLELAELQIGEGDITGARETLINVEKINPNSEELIKLRRSL